MDPVTEGTLPEEPAPPAVAIADESGGNPALQSSAVPEENVKAGVEYTVNATDYQGPADTGMGSAPSPAPQLSALFQDDSYVAVINTHIAAVWQAENSRSVNAVSRGTESAVSFTSIRTDQPFYINAAGQLVIVFPAGELDEVEREFVIPADLIQDLWEPARND
jgi:hypothetical protein